ncbi:MAG: tRNA (adenosine(37)-N6)-threonylcarbamoyltransferase complex ATPase subunit type 1 TsaE [Firmicutes bacterium]|nr:tRNA (adenosine(37)-N6)-threonylcarbamoyltransferase complex ATPase subunit type 1 TsaE [Bacillota bacterium]
MEHDLPLLVILQMRHDATLAQVVIETVAGRPAAARPAGNRSEFLTNSPDETLALAGRIGEAIRFPAVIGLSGQLGAGKTLFARGLAGGLGVKGHVTSPSFTLVHTYRGRMTVHHLDVYRLDNPAEIEDLGFHEMLDEAVVIVEWADRVERFMPSERLDVVIERVGREEAPANTRHITMTARGEAHCGLVRGLSTAGTTGRKAAPAAPQPSKSPAPEPASGTTEGGDAG